MRRPVRVGHHFQVAMIGGDHDNIIGSQSCIHYLPKLVVDGSGAFDFRFTIRCVTDDITIGKVGHDQIVFPLDATYYFFTNLRQAQFGNLFERHAFGRGDADIFFTLKTLVFTAIQEKRDVRKLLRLSGAQLAQPSAADRFAERISDFGWCEGNRQVFEFFVIEGQDDER